MTPRIRRRMAWAYLIAGPVLATVVLVGGWLLNAHTGSP